MVTTTNATKKWSANPKPAVTRPPLNEFAPSNPAAIPCNPRRAPTPRCHQMTKADEMSKTPTTKPAVRIARNAPELFIDFRGAYSGKLKIRKQRNNRGEKWTSCRKSVICAATDARHGGCAVRRPAWFSWFFGFQICCYLLEKNVFSDSNSNRSSDL